MAQPPEKPSLDDEHGLLDLRLGKGRRLQVTRVRSAKRCGSHIPSIRFAVANSS
jgi:hypothetical protein